MTKPNDAPAANQCDGCRRGMPIVNGIHRGGEWDSIACTAERYAPAALPDVRYPMTPEAICTSIVYVFNANTNRPLRIRAIQARLSMNPELRREPTASAPTIKDIRNALRRQQLRGQAVARGPYWRMATFKEWDEWRREHNQF